MNKGKMTNKTLWKKSDTLEEQIELFTVGKDRDLDLFLAEFDVIGSLAHITMLESVGLLEQHELEVLKRELAVILDEIRKETFIIEEGVEDIHSQIELLLTERLGEVGKKKAVPSRLFYLKAFSSSPSPVKLSLSKYSGTGLPINLSTYKLARYCPSINP